ncbi:MAG: methylated-DNA--[protein]-cysteine S-methyltransferase [Oscillospiraceae bacterium]
MDLLLYDSPVGRLGLMGEGDCLIALTLPNQPVPLIAPRETPVLRETQKQLEAYFAGKLRSFDVPLRLEGTPFCLRVWEQLQKIPYGQVISYGELARRVGQPNAARAVGGANHHNPISILVPCHRVIAADGTLGGYGGGLELKRALLKLEGLDL